MMSATLCFGTLYTYWPSCKSSVSLACKGFNRDSAGIYPTRPKITFNNNDRSKRNMILIDRRMMPRLLVAAGVRCSCLMQRRRLFDWPIVIIRQLRGIFDWPIVIIWQFCVFHRGDLGLWKKFYIKWRVLGKGWSGMAPVLARGSPFPFLSLFLFFLFFERSMYILNAITHFGLVQIE